MCVVRQFEGCFIEPGAKLAFPAYQQSREGKGPEPGDAMVRPDQDRCEAWWGRP